MIGMTSRNLPAWPLVAAVALAALLAGCMFSRLPGEGEPDGTVLPPEIVAAGALRVGVIPGRPPYLDADATAETGFVGLEMRLLAALSAEVGLPLRVQSYPEEAGLFAALRAGDIDLAVPAATEWTILRHAHAPCARHVPTGQRFVVRRAAAAFLTALPQLDRPEIVALAVVATAGAEMAPGLLPKARRETYPDLASALARLAGIDGGVLVTDARTASELARDPQRALAAVFAVQGAESLAWAVRSGDVAWQRWLDRFMAGVRDSGRLAEWWGEIDGDAILGDPAATGG